MMTIFICGLSPFSMRGRMSGESLSQLRWGGRAGIELGENDSVIPRPKGK